MRNVCTRKTPRNRADLYSVCREIDPCSYPPVHILMSKYTAIAAKSPLSSSASRADTPASRKRRGRRHRRPQPRKRSPPPLCHLLDPLSSQPYYGDSPVTHPASDQPVVYTTMCPGAQSRCTIFAASHLLSSVFTSSPLPPLLPLPLPFTHPL